MAKRKTRSRLDSNGNGPSLPALSASQLEVMRHIWNLGEVTVTEVWNRVTSEREIARNTVLTVMDRLVKRGWLQKRRVGNTQLYQAVIEQEESNGDVVRRMVDSVFSGAADQMVAALLNGRGVSEEEISRIKKMIDAKRREKKKAEEKAEEKAEGNCGRNTTK